MPRKSRRLAGGRKAIKQVKETAEEANGRALKLLELALEEVRVAAGTPFTQNIIMRRPLCVVLTPCCVQQWKTSVKHWN